jgi:hypothetical protein
MSSRKTRKHREQTGGWNIFPADINRLTRILFAVDNSGNILNNHTSNLYNFIKQEEHLKNLDPLNKRPLTQDDISIFLSLIQPYDGYTIDRFYEDLYYLQDNPNDTFLFFKEGNYIDKSNIKKYLNLWMDKESEYKKMMNKKLGLKKLSKTTRSRVETFCQNEKNISYPMCISHMALDNGQNDSLLNPRVSGSSSRKTKRTRTKKRRISKSSRNRL